MTQSTHLNTSTVQGRIAFIKAAWHAAIVDKALAGFLAEMTRLGRRADAVDVFDTPGAFEIPLQAQTLARTGRYAAVVAAALVTDGGIYRHEFVAETVVRALMQVQLETGMPILSVVLTPHHFHGGEEHQRFFQDHFVTKGEEAARACVQTVEGLGRLRAAA
jgi:6,7-dimethyl-8-ribityllumazine synthase